MGEIPVGVFITALILFWFLGYSQGRNRDER